MGGFNAICERAQNALEIAMRDENDAEAVRSGPRNAAEIAMRGQRMAGPSLVSKTYWLR
jgi:hypothetical protein